MHFLRRPLSNFYDERISENQAAKRGESSKLRHVLKRPIFISDQNVHFLRLLRLRQPGRRPPLLRVEPPVSRPGQQAAQRGARAPPEVPRGAGAAAPETATAAAQQPK